MNAHRLYLAVGIGVAVLALIGYAAARRAGVLPNADTFNPLSTNNLAYRGANEVYRALSGNAVDTIGTALASGYSDRVGEEITRPVQIAGGRVVEYALPVAYHFNPLTDTTAFWYAAP